MSVELVAIGPPRNAESYAEPDTTGSRQRGFYQIASTLGRAAVTHRDLRARAGDLRRAGRCGGDLTAVLSGPRLGPGSIVGGQERSPDAARRSGTSARAESATEYWTGGCVRRQRACDDDSSTRAGAHGPLDIVIAITVQRGPWGIVWSFPPRSVPFVSDALRAGAEVKATAPRRDSIADVDLEPKGKARVAVQQLAADRQGPD